MEENAHKRIRTANYSLEEKNVLMQLVNKYKHVIENKKTDACSNNEKEVTFKKICDEFNSVAPNNIHRNVNSLKKAYLNMKKNVRKEAADERLSLIKTGGGPPDTKVISTIRDITLDTINKKTVFGLENEFDSDITMLKGSNISEELPEFDENDDVEVIYVQTETETDNVSEATNSKWVPKNLKQPLNENLQQKLNYVKPQVQQNVDNLDMWRRPGATALHSSEISKKYTELCDERLEIAKIEKCALERKMRYDEEKHDLEMKLMRAELKLKEQQLLNKT